MAPNTLIHGIAASENIDSSGEKISIEGLDISSLEQSGVLNYEHQSGLPAQVVGRIIKAKKIFSLKDCEDEYQRHFWKKCQVPYLYVIGELLDQYTDSAKDVAGKFRYDADNRGRFAFNIMNFSIEGATLEKKGMDVLRSIARKLTLTVAACNKTAEAELVPLKSVVREQSDDLSEIFKTESMVEIQLFKNEDLIKAEPNIPGEKGEQPKEAPAPKPAEPPKEPAVPGANAHLHSKLGNSDELGLGAHLGSTTSGKNVFTNHKVHEYHGWNSKDHREAADIHRAAAADSKDSKATNHHLDKMRLHTNVANTKDMKSNRFAKERAARTKAILSDKKVMKSEEPLNKALEAGSGIAAPGQVSQGAALQKESLDKKTKKATWLARAEEEYKNWDKKEEFRDFMKKKLPSLALSEIDAIGKTIALKKSHKAEKSLAKMYSLQKALKFGSEEDQKKVAAALEERKKNPPKKPEPAKKAPDLKGPIESSVSHVETNMGHTPTGSHELDTVHLESGHKSFGHPKGKFKVGDKVTMKPHLMGTHILEHKK